MVLLATTSALCQNVNFMDFSHVGDCFVQFATFGDFMLMGIILVVVFAMLLYMHNFPMALTLPIGSILMLTVYFLGGGMVFLSFFVLGLAVAGAILIISILSYTNR